MKPIPLPSLEIVRDSFYLDEKTWMLRHKKKFGISAGSIAGNKMDSGYIRVKCKGKLYLAHRIIYLLHYGVDPGNLEVDHKDGNKENNNPENLRLATRSENRMNVGHFSNNKLKKKGVYYHKASKSYYCGVQKNNQRKIFGPFSCPDEAKEKYNQMAKSQFGEYYKEN